MLTAAQLDLEKERAAKAALEKERDELSDEIESLVRMNGARVLLSNRVV